MSAQIDSERASFETEGFIIRRGFSTVDEIRDLNSHVELFIEKVVPALSREEVFYEDLSDRSTLKQIQQLGEHDGYFHALQHESKFRALAEKLLDGPVIPKNLQYFNKPAGRGQPTPPHQDGYYFKLDPCDAVTMWLALDEVDEENGCVRYVPGSLREGLLPHDRTGTLGFSQGIAAEDYEPFRDRESAVSAVPGDLIVHHALTIHRADRNRSASRERRALGFIYYAARAKEDELAHADYLERVRREWEEAGRI